MTRYRFVEAESGRYSVTRLCRMAEVSRAAYYQWQEGRGRRARRRTRSLRPPGPGGMPRRFVLHPGCCEPTP
jgi:hypothetical protein